MNAQSCLTHTPKATHTLNSLQSWLFLCVLRGMKLSWGPVGLTEVCED